MGCGCGGGAKTVAKSVQTYEIEGDPNQIKYLTERDALDQKARRELAGEVVPTR